MIMNEE